MFLEKIRQRAEANVASGYYEAESRGHRRKSLASLLRRNFSLIAEVKRVSPVEGKLFDGDAVEFARSAKKAGAAGISVVVEPGVFGGRLADVAEISKNKLGPVLAKDFVFHERQLQGIAAAGADAALLIAKFLQKESRNELIDTAHGLGLEAVLEVSNGRDLRNAMRGDADVIGINQRDLESLRVDDSLALRLLSRNEIDRPVLIESGISTREQVAELQRAGADGVLVGTAILRAAQLDQKIVELIG